MPMPAKMKTVELAVLPQCQICEGRPAVYDAKTKSGPWAYLCKECYKSYGAGILSLTTRLIKAEAPTVQQ